MDGWRYNSPSLETVSLHDMVIDDIVDRDGNIHLIFSDGFAITRDNSENSSGRHLQTGPSALVLHGGFLVSGRNIEEDCDVNFKQLQDDTFEVLSIERVSNRIIIFCSNRNQCFCELIFECQSLVLVWNDTQGDAWFQDWPVKIS